MVTRTDEDLAFGADSGVPALAIEGRRDSTLCGTRALRLAVLEDGIRCFQQHRRAPRTRPRLLAQEAELWIAAVDYDEPFSFNNVCEALGINPDALRRALCAWKQNGSTAAEATRTPAPLGKSIYRLHLRGRRRS